MTDEEVPDSPVPWDVLQPVIAWMLNHGIGELRLVSAPVPDQTTTDPTRDESGYLFFCDATPDAPGLRNVYAVSDPQGGGMLNGPTPIPRSVLHPLLKALDELSVSEFHIDTRSEPSDDESEGSDCMPGPNLPDAFEEHELPATDNWPPVVIAVQLLPEPDHA